MVTMEILELKDIKTVPDPIHQYPKYAREGDVPIVIDNGSYNCRIGWAVSESPLLIFKNLIAKPRKERGKKDGETQVGNDIVNIEAVRFQLKTQFDRNVVTHIDVQEQIFDYTFFHLGIDTEGYVNHPIVLTEAVLNPNYSRMLMSELLFECYHVPGVAYGVDCLYSLSRNGLREGSSLVVSLGYQSTHVLPVLDGTVDWARARRLDVGGSHITAYLHRLLQLKYPAHFAAITLSRAEELLHEHCYIAKDYGEDLNNWSCEEHYEQHVRRIQLPYSVGLSTEQQRERRKELARRLMEINARKREQKLAEDEEQLNQLLAVQEMADEGNEQELQRALKLFNLSSPDDLQKLVDQVQVRIERTRQKIVTANTAEESNIEEPKPKVSKYVTTPRDEEDLQQWVVGIKKKRQELLERRNARRQRRQDMARRRTVAAQERMRLINQLARKEKKDDDFGMRDEDWDVYKAINKEGGDTDSDEETEKLLELEEILRCHDPMFEGNNDQSATPGEAHQLHVGVERVRAAEVLFQPSMIGSHQAGLAETIQFVLKCYDEPTANALVSTVFLTGSCALIPGLSDRIVKELREMRPFKSKFSVQIASDPALDAWMGARDFALDPDVLDNCISRQEYLDKGGEYLKEHRTSNMYCPSPVPLKLVDTINISTAVVQEEIEVDIM
ncbi:actin-related protein 5 isoform X2 [Homalodisca vitripennis]|uniref:actin-related protein 5 isoform X2 n=1 Tax=Homalodisca vitripennis TaxID=197043 RepID=UPI001EEA03DF|nr:actin-related protein 5 isoform X2 [Homalodisca vitripennis]